MLGLWSLGSAPLGLSLHIALTASLEDVSVACDALRSAGVTPLSFFGAETTEPSVIGWMPAAAVYFRDPDGHLIEYLAMLDDAGAPRARDRPVVGVGACRAGAGRAPQRSARRAAGALRGGRGLRPAAGRLPGRGRGARRAPRRSRRRAPAADRRRRDGRSGDPQHGRRPGPARARDRPHAAPGGHRAHPCAAPPHARRRHRRRRRRQPALLPTRRLSPALGASATPSPPRPATRPTPASTVSPCATASGSTCSSMPRAERRRSLSLGAQTLLPACECRDLRPKASHRAATIRRRFARDPRQPRARSLRAHDKDTRPGCDTLPAPGPGS